MMCFIVFSFLLFLGCEVEENSRARKLRGNQSTKTMLGRRKLMLELAAEGEDKERSDAVAVGVQLVMLIKDVMMVS